MFSWRDSKCQTTEAPDEAVLNISYRQSVQQLHNVHHTDDNDRHTGTCMLCPEDEKLINDSTISNSMLLLQEPCSSFQDQDYVKKIKELHMYVDMVKKIVRPGCSSEILNVALSSMIALVKTLSAKPSKQWMHSSL